MKKAKKVKYFQIAANIVGFNFRDGDVDLLVTLYDVMLRKGGSTSLRDITGVQAENKTRFKKEEPKTPDEKPEDTTTK